MALLNRSLLACPSAYIAKLSICFAAPCTNTRSAEKVFLTFTFMSHGSLLLLPLPFLSRAISLRAVWSGPDRQVVPAERPADDVARHGALLRGCARGGGQEEGGGGGGRSRRCRGRSRRGRRQDQAPIGPAFWRESDRWGWYKWRE
eukprot:1082405-Pleurochrysis_carterae.AAC.2